MQIILSLAVTLTLGLAVMQCDSTSILKSSSQNTANTTNVNAAPTKPAAQTGDEAPRIALADAKKDFDDNAALFVDTRGESSYKDEHIKGAINISAENFDAKYKELPKDGKIIAYCS